MQLSLTTTLPRNPRAAVLRPLVPLSREAAMSQLDQIAAASGQRVTRQDGLGGVSTVLALIGGLVLVGAAAMWRSPADALPAAPPVTRAPAPPVAAAPAAVALPVVAEAAPVAPAAEAPALPALRESAPEVVAAAAIAEPAPVTLEPSAEELAQKARVRQLADARRKAAALAQERMAAEEAQRLQAASQRREAELAAQQADEQRRQRAAAAAEAAARQAQAVSLAVNTRRSVRETCNGRGLFAEGACHVRECARSEHQGDPVCVRQRDADEAQRRASIER